MIARLLISPSLDKRVEEINKILSEAGLKNPHPDLLYLSSETKLGISEARKIKEHFSFKPFQAKGRGVVLEDASTLTVEAQNALLKTLEELPETGLFILSADSDFKLLSTVLSRCQIIRLQPKGERDETTDYTKDIEKLLESTIEERFEYVEKLKDREGFLKFLPFFFHKNLVSHKDFLKELLQAEEWANQNVNIRAILEYLMLVMPKN